MSKFENKYSTPFPLNQLQRRVREEFIRALDMEDHVLVDVEFCANCNSSRLDKVAEMERFELPFKAKICCDCGLIMTTPHLSEGFLPRYYKEFYTALVLGREDMRELIHMVHPRQGKMIYDFCRAALRMLGKKNLTVVEVGCASGQNLSQFSLKARADGISCRLVGSEYSQYFKEYAEEKLGIRYIIGSLGDLIQEGVSADVLILSHVFEHFVDLKAAKKQFQQILAPEGLLYIEVPGVLDLQNKFEYECNFIFYRVHAHIYDFSLTTLRNVLYPEFSLIKGTEFCRALFKKTRSNDRGVFDLNDYEHIRHYLQKVETYRRKHRKWIHARSLLRRGIRKIRRDCYYLGLIVKT